MSIAVHARPRPSPLRPKTLDRQSSARPLPMPIAQTMPASSPRPSPTVALRPAPCKDTSSSSGKVFAKPSKDWVVPERAKPGRKLASGDPENSRQSQNRMSQRAHRARRTDYVQTLEERLRAYEADEIHSNVRLQGVARALKADNERLKAEVAVIRGRDGWEEEKKGLEELVRNLKREVETLRAEKGVGFTPSRPSEDGWSPALDLATSTITQKKIPMDCPICPDPDPECPCQGPAPLEMPSLPVQTVIPSPSTCGLCQSIDDCLCRAVAADIPPVLPGPTDGCGLCTSASFCACEHSPAPITSTAAIPLRRRSRNRATASNVTPVVWAIEKTSPSMEQEAACSGDPTDCDACRDDSFGREFCASLFQRTDAACAGRPGLCMSIENLLCAPDPSYEQRSERATLLGTDHSDADDAETMRPDQVWRNLKAHPNVKLTPLSMLADVVARRTRCIGPRVELSPPPPVGKRRIEVETSAVREALRLLDDVPSPIEEREGKRRRCKG